MKRYNIRPVEREFKWGKMKVVELGEKGRGRTLTLIPYHAPEDAEYLALATTRTGKPKIIKGYDAEDKWLAVLSGAGTYTRGTHGDVYVPIVYADKVKVIADGHGAYGDAGRIGGWEEYLAVVEDNTWIRVAPAGGAGKIPRYWLYFSENEVIRIENEEMDIFLEQHPDVEDPRHWKRVRLSSIGEGIETTEWTQYRYIYQGGAIDSVETEGTVGYSVLEIVKTLKKSEKAEAQVIRWAKDDTIAYTIKGDTWILPDGSVWVKIHDSWNNEDVAIKIRNGVGA